MKRALVIGATGGMGYALVKELAKRGIEVVAFARGAEKLARLFAHEKNVTIYPGDAFERESLQQAAKGVDAIYYAMNIPYSQWEEKLIVLMQKIIDTAQEAGAKLVVVDNIYAYGRSNGEKVSEDYEKRPQTKKGKIRLQLDTLIKQSEVEALIAHFPDFYGPNAESTLLHYTFNNVVQNKRAMFVGNQSIQREYIFTPDGAKALVELSMQGSAFGQNWNIPGSGVISGDEIIRMVRELTGYQQKVRTVTKTMIWLLGLFNKDMKEVVEMMYLNEEPVVLSGGKLEQAIGTVPRTSYQHGIEQTLAFMKQQMGK